MTACSVGVRLVRVVELVFLLLFVGMYPARAEIVDLTPDGVLSGAWFIPDAELNRVDAYLYIRSGEHDAVGTEGLSHYLEHLVWQHAIGAAGSGKVGRDTNAFTTGDSTIYVLADLPDKFEDNLKTLARVLKHRSWHQALLRMNGRLSSRSIRNAMQNRLGFRHHASSKSLFMVQAGGRAL